MSWARPGESQGAVSPDEMSSLCGGHSFTHVPWSEKSRKPWEPAAQEQIKHTQRTWREATDVQEVWTDTPTPERCKLRLQLGPLRAVPADDQAAKPLPLWAMGSTLIPTC